jgi:hypothetical protein
VKVIVTWSAPLFAATVSGEIEASPDPSGFVTLMVGLPEASGVRRVVALPRDSTLNSAVAPAAAPDPIPPDVIFP